MFLRVSVGRQKPQWVAKRPGHDTPTVGEKVVNLG
jgi:hypothetical protein